MKQAVVVNFLGILRLYVSLSLSFKTLVLRKPKLTLISSPPVTRTPKGNEKLFELGRGGGIQVKGVH